MQFSQSNNENSLSGQKESGPSNYNHSTKRSQNQVQIPLITHLENQYNGKMPPKTTTSRQGKMRASYGGNSAVSIMSNDTPEAQSFQQKLSIQNQYVQYSKDGAVANEDKEPAIGLSPENSAQQIVSKQALKNQARQFDGQGEFVQ
jgi:hypothetical protein